MKFAYFSARTSPFLFALVVAFLDSPVGPLAAPLASQGRLQPYGVPGTAVGEGLILSYTVNSPTGQAGGFFNDGPLQWET